MFGTNSRQNGGCLVPRVFVPLDQRSGNERLCRVLIGSPKISDYRLNCACLADKHVAQSSRWCFTSAYFIVFKTNQNRACNGALEIRSFRQACAVRNEASRNEIGCLYNKTADSILLLKSWPCRLYLSRLKHRAEEIKYYFPPFSNHREALVKREMFGDQTC